MKEDVLTCICILLKKFIAADDVAKAGRIFHQHGILSAGQKKKFKGSPDQIFSKLYSVAGEKSDEIFFKAISDEDFPIDQEVLNVIDFLLKFENASFLRMIKAWDEGRLAAFKKELKPLAGAVPKKTDWFKPLLFIAFNEEILDEEERPVYDAIMSKIQSIPSSAKPEQSPVPVNDETSTTDKSSEANTVKPQKKKAKKKNKHTGKGKVPKKADLSGNNPKPLKQGDGVDTATEKSEEILSKGTLKSSGNNSDEARCAATPKCDNKNIPPDGSDADIQSNTSNHNRSQNVLPNSPSDQQFQSTNKVASSTTENANARNLPVSDRNLRSKSGDKNTKNPNETSDAGKSNFNNGVQNTTMNRKSAQNDISQDRTATLARNDVWPEAFHNQERFLEIRAIVSRDSRLPPDKGLCMIYKDNNFTPVSMAYNKRKEFYYLRVHCPVNYAGPFIYKFCYKDGESIRYECLPRTGYVNRMLDLEQVKSSWLVLLNVCTFQSSLPSFWLNRCVKELEQLLPEPEYIFSGFHDDNDTTAVTDAFCWLNCVRYGWLLFEEYYYAMTTTTPVLPATQMYQEVVMNWLALLNSYLQENKNFQNSKKLLTMALVVALSIHEEKICCRKLLSALFQMLQINELDPDECSNFLEEIMSLSKHYESIGCNIPRFHDALAWLYQKILDVPSFDWILTLPLYWLVANRQLKREVNAKCNNDFIRDYCCLPSIKGHSWDRVRQSCMSTSVNRTELLDMIPTILKLCEVHPWITGTFQFMLNAKELAQLVHKDHDIVKHFRIDFVLLRYLEGYSSSGRAKMSEDEIASFDTYFNKALQSSISSASEGVTENSEIPAKCDVKACLSMMRIVGDYSTKYSDPLDVSWLVENVWHKTVELLTLNILNHNQKKVMVSMFTKVLREIKKGIHSRNVGKFEIQFWDKLLGVRWQSQDLSEQWKRELENEMKNAINNFCQGGKASDKFLHFYANTLADMDLKSDVRKYFDDKAFRIADDIMQKPEQIQWIKKLLDTMAEKLKSFINKHSSVTKHPIVMVFERLFIRAYNKDRKASRSDDTNALLLMCTWSFSAKFYELFGKEFLKLFSSEAQQHITSVSKGFKAVVNLLLKEDILVEQINIIATHEDQFYQVCKALGIIKQVATDGSSVDKCMPSVDQALSTLKKCHGVFKRTKGTLEDFIQLCNSINFGDAVPHEELEKKIQVKTGQLKVMGLVNGTDRSSSTGFFGITDEQLIEFQKMSFLKDSKILFHNMFKSSVEALQKHLKRDLLWHDLLQAWDSIETKIFELVNVVDSGILTLQDVTEQFELLAGDRDNIDLEVQLLYDFTAKYNNSQGPLEHLEERRLQIYNAFKVQKANRAITILLGVKALLHLQGDFSSIIKRKEMIENRREIHLYEVPATLEILEISEIDDVKLKIIEQFMKGEKVINWLQGKMKGIQGVQVLCDLAMISAGEDAIELGRVSCFLSAVMGFAPLIFWKVPNRIDDENKHFNQPLQINDDADDDDKAEPEDDIFRLFEDKYIDENSQELDCPLEDANVSCEEAGLTHLLERCRRVWEKAGNGETLLLHWEETVRHLSWFEDVEKFYGSVEKSSLTRAQAINERGVYMIKKLSDASENCPENALQLQISQTEQEDRAQVMSLEALQELQSKLMLIAGDAEKVQRDVNHFVNVLTSVQKLTEAYVELKSSGCMLFSGWEASVDCNEGKDLIIRISFTPDHQLHGQGNHLHLDQITQILKDTLYNWQEYVSAKRMEYYHLNEFNIDQIMYLSHQLSILNKAENVPDQVRTLLSFVTPGLEDAELRECVEQILLELDQEVEIDQVAVDDASSGFDESDTGEEESNEQVKVARLKLKAVKNLEAKERVAARIAKAAVEAEGYSDNKKCLEWILLNELDDDLVDELNSDFERSCQGFAVERKEAKVIQSAFRINSNNTLNEVIARLQKTVSDENTTIDGLLNSIKTICKGYIDETIMMNLQDHLSVTILGKILSRLHKPRNVHRDLLSGLISGRPNLLICNRNDILSTVISIYMTNPKQPLPSRSEVLICTEETNKDEVERFFRRAMCDRGDKDQLIYCLAFADNLSFSISAAVDTILTKLKGCNHIDQKYQLVVLLSKQQHALATYFDKNVVDGKWLRRFEDIQKYLASHLTVHNHRQSAASVTKGHYNVKVISSTRSGVGKSLHVQRLKENFEQMIYMNRRTVTLRLLENKLDFDYVIRKLCSANHCNADPVLVHIDMTPAVQHGIQSFAFNLFVLGSIQGSNGRVWMRQSSHLYLVEATDFSATGEVRFLKSHILNLLPTVHCQTPLEFVKGNRANRDEEWLGMDRKEFESETFQRPFQYLTRYQQGLDLTDFSFSFRNIEGNEEECVRVLLKHCYMENPSWAQLRHFSSFLNFQLRNCENSVFCSHPFFKPALLGLKLFAVRFMIKMAQDFATPSLLISDTSMRDTKTQSQQGIEGYQLRRKWEENSHPYVFFNEDGHSMTFVNVKIDRQGNLLDKNDQIVENIITPQLTTTLHQQGFNLRKNFDDYTRKDKLRFICQVLGIDDPFDPDPTYELTTDNVLKILAIYTRFKCGIPVIIMGETGCGKTRLVEFMSKLKAGKAHFENMTTLKIHGGITVKNIHESVSEAKQLEINAAHQKNFTVLFFDEANTTEAIYAIKEVMCDRSIDGSFFQDSHLNLVAACNPYKKLSKKAIKKLEDSGLGYRIHTSKTTHLFGNIPVRSLVYRVVALPPSMQPFVWDFGQLGDEAEMVYIQQMCQKLARTLQLCQASVNLLVKMLSCCQKFMRSRRDECRYVSLRDVERCMTTFEWFFQKRQVVCPLIEEELNKKYQKLNNETPTIQEDVRTMIQTVGVCYYASLDDREQFLQELEGCLGLPGIDAAAISTELICCQTVFLRNIQVGNNIACNQALRENVFMMAVCMDMRIPLFLIGKPGSSKSLAKTIIQNNMLGEDSHAMLYQNLKKVHVLSYQCSALTDADGIQRVFNQCVQLQQNQNLDTYTAVVVLDEIGLAEDSPNMPLKILHPLLERRSAELKTVAHSEIVGFVGISNWALDPAKMNRGIFLTRSKPDEGDLNKTGREIFQGRNSLWRTNRSLLSGLTSSYIKMYADQETEYFGLRDYYSLMKMICTRSNDPRERVSLEEVSYAIRRNFGGGKSEVVEGFLTDASNAIDTNTHNPVLPIQQMILDNLSETNSRFLLLLTNQFSIVSLLGSFITNKAQVVFGSSFPGDHTYTEICRNINKIKVCMETGKTVILLNMTKIHESLYDALNQHFVTFGGQNYVDLGLGGHRVKCRIAKEFRLIVIEKKDVVRKEYPIPLINRLEKHHFSCENLLDETQRKESHKLNEWMSRFTSRAQDFSSQHTFIGCHDDSASSVVLTTNGNSFSVFKEVLLQTCSMDAISRLRNSQHTEGEIQSIENIYFNIQHHDSLMNVLEDALENEYQFMCLEITSFSGGLWERDVLQLQQCLHLKNKSITLIPLEHFETQEQYCTELQLFFDECNRDGDEPLIALIQCSQAQKNSSLVACARHCLMNKVKEFQDNRNGLGRQVVIALLLSMEREGINESSYGSLALQHTTKTTIIHVDEFRFTDDHISPASKFFNTSLHQVFQDGNSSLLRMKSLFLDSVAECVIKVKDDHAEPDRYSKRISILMNMFSGDGVIEMKFQRIFLDKVQQAFKQIDQQLGQEFSWVVEEANNGESLQEGGTFRKTLWLCLKRHVSKIMACVVSIADQRNNMDIIVNPNVSALQLNMWLEMFEGLQIDWDNMLKSTTYVIAGQKQLQNRPCQVPFSFLIFGYLEDQWVALQSQGFRSEQDIYPRIFNGFHLRKAVIDALQNARVDIMKMFTQDLVATLHQLGTKNDIEFDVIWQTLYELSVKKFQQWRNKTNIAFGDEIGIIFCTFKTMSERLVKFSQVLKSCPDILKNHKTWTAEQENADDIILHHTALKDAVIELRNKAEGIEKCEKCILWIDQARIIKELYKSISRMITDEAVLKQINNNWIPLQILDLLLQQLLPPADYTSEFYRKVVKTIAPPAKLFWRGTVNRDPRSLNFFKIVLNVLKKCLAEIKLQLNLGWQDDTMCHVCQKKVCDPVILPCSHFLCEKCIPKLIANVNGITRCITCRKTIPDDHDLVVKELDTKSVKFCQRMKLNCTSFFVECLEQFCFKREGNRNAMSQQIELMLDEIILEMGDIDRPQLDSTGLDLNINFKSCVFQILLNYNPDYTTALVQKYFDTQPVSNTNLFITVLLKAYQQKALTETTVFQQDVEKLTRQWHKILHYTWNELTENANQFGLSAFQKVTDIRCGLYHFASLLDKRLKHEKYPENIEFLKFCRTVLTEDETPPSVKEFLIKVGYRKYGKQWLFQLAQDQEFNVLIPPHLRQSAEDSSTNFWALLGQEYIHTKSQLYQNQPEDYETAVAGIFNMAQDNNVLPQILAVLTWMANKEEQVKTTLMEVMRFKCVDYPEFLAVPFERLRQMIDNNVSTQHNPSMIYQLTVITVAAVRSSSNGILSGFSKILDQPMSILQTILPTMPENRFFLMPLEYRLENQQHNSMYKCPKGHLYSIGNCTQPAQQAKCPECNSNIGGLHYVPAAGNQKFTLTPQSQAGYMPNKTDGNHSTGSERMSLQGFAATQFILHSCLLVASLERQDAVARVLQQEPDAVTEFLIRQLEQNLLDLSKGLARNMDDSTLIMFRVLLRIIKQEEKKHTENWQTMESRRAWELTFREEYLRPIFRDIDNEINKASQAMKEDEEVGATPLKRLISDLDEDDAIAEIDEEWKDEMTWMHSSLWRIIENQDSGHLIQVLEDAAEDTPGDVLQIILKTGNLHLVKHLEGILSLQQSMVNRYRYRLDLGQANETTLRQHIVNCSADEERLIENYINAWNEIYRKLKGVAPEFLHEFFEEMTLDSPLCLVMPSLTGPGQCAKLLTEYLIETQNRFLEECVAVIKPYQTLEEVEISQVRPTDIVCIDKSKDLIGMIDKHTSYNIYIDDDGRHHQITYNIEALEKQVREKYILSKKRINKNSLPYMKYPQDVGIGTDWMDVISSIPQVPLTAMLQQKVDSNVACVHSAEICEAVRILTNAISFLAMVKTPLQKKLQEFLEKDLKISFGRATIIPGDVEITHILSLYQRLAWHKAVIFTKQGLDPYKEILCAVEQARIPDDLLQKTADALEKIDVILLQQRINEIFITDQVKKADWSLVEEVFPYVRLLDDSDDDSWYSDLPEELCNEHLSHLFKLTVLLK